MEGCYERVLSSGGSGAVLGGESRAFRRGRVERVEMRCGLEAAMTYSDGYKHMFFGDLVTWRLSEWVTWREDDGRGGEYVIHLDGLLTESAWVSVSVYE